MTDTNIAAANPKLLKAIEALQEGMTEAAEQAFFDELWDAQFLAPALVGQDSKMGYFTLTTEDNKETFYPAFTDWNELRKWNPDPAIHAACTTLDNYTDMILNKDKDGINGFVINPFGCNFTITRHVLEALQSRFLEDKDIGDDDKVKLATPKNVPADMYKAINAFLKTRKRVKKAYLRMMLQYGIKSYLMIFDGDDYDMQTLCEGVFNAAKPYLGKFNINFVNYTPGKQNFIDGCQPFYKKKFLGFF